MRPVRRLAALASLGIALGSLATTILLSEGALHILVRPRPDRLEADALARGTRSTWESAGVTASDGVRLDGWLFTPDTPNGSGVILLHGVGDTRSGMARHADYLLRAGFTVLLPDLRGHGSSGGSTVTYGIRESGDVRAWVEWLAAKRPIAHLYGLGQSLGAAILLESLAGTTRFRAVVADCPFDSFEDVARYRLHRTAGIPRWATRPVMQAGLLYTRAIYGFDLRQASPADAVRHTNVPVLLIHGTADTHIPASESVALHALNPQSTTLWLVPGAEHIDSLGTAPREYIRRVTEWFLSHP